jgi:hypothetical protein
MASTVTSEGSSRNAHSGVPFASKLPEYLTRRIDFAAPEGCWKWLGSVTPQGYAQTKIHGKATNINRRVFSLINGHDADTIVHSCHTRSGCKAQGTACPHKRCLNPMHMVSVSAKLGALVTSNSWSRQTTCKHGHELTPDNVLIAKQPNGRTGFRRLCRLCAKHHAKLRKKGLE